MKRLVAYLTVALLGISCATAEKPEISYSELRDKVAGAWLGQMVGNIYGLEYENKFIEEPGVPPFVFNKAMKKMTAVDGAFSDDDTDVEYLYLLMMEKYGVHPTYAQIRDGWMYHIRDRVWLANRATLGNMHYGLTPPFTGDKRYNPHWFQIDPQLINEIWGYTAPGMPEYAAGISEWAARITSDDWATSPTVVYGAIYSEAFFESDIETLITHAMAYLPKEDRFRHAIQECIDLYKQYPDDMRAARQIIADEFYVNEDSATKTIWNADLNGAMGILALLYGQGDIEKTLLAGCSLGFDADNQTATICGLLGVIHGADAVPTTWSMPFEHWTMPFNDRYINVTRYDMPDASIQDLIDRTTALAAKIIVENGGEEFERDGQKWYRINPSATFKAPLEFCVGPNPRIVAGEEVDYDFACCTNRGYNWKLAGGRLPKGLSFKGGKLKGTTNETGDFDITLSLSDGKQTIEKNFHLVVRGRNIAPEAEEILSRVRETDFDILDSCWTTVSHSFYAKDISVINDGVLDGPGSAFYSLAEKTTELREDYFGYRWAEPRRIDMLAFHYGCLEEFGGWYSNMRVEYMDEEGNWKKIESTVSPALPESDAVFIQPHNAEFLFRFAPVKTCAIRVIGQDAVLIHWNKYTKNVSSFISISELQAYEAADNGSVSFTEEVLLDKIRGGWAGQTIGVVYGAPTEFKHCGTIIPDYQPISWGEGYVKYWWDIKPGLFDDVYNDLTFAKAFYDFGIDCSSAELAQPFAYADYHLAHANQAGRYNIRQGIMPPMSGHWLNNPHADDLDFQIEADFVGLMTPAMLPEAMEVANKTGHIMNSGDGFYGGVFVAGLYSAAFVEKSPEAILDKALFAIPKESSFYQCIDDVRKLHAQYPEDWKAAWFELQKKWDCDCGCPKGVFLSFNIDAKINSAYVALGLLYGEGDFAKSMEIATRCGQDSDCNPATIAGVLGVMTGYSGIPEFWANPVKEIWDCDFQGTDVSLEKGSKYCFELASQFIKRTGGKIENGVVSIPQTNPAILPLEQNFINTHPIYRDQKDAWMSKEYEFDFNGNGFVIWGNLVCLRGITPEYAARVSKKHVGSEVFALAEENDDYVAEIEVWIDGQLDQVSILPMKGTSRKLEPAWKYLLPEGRHHVKMVWKNPVPSTYLLRINSIQYYSENPLPDKYYHN